MANVVVIRGTGSWDRGWVPWAGKWSVVSRGQSVNLVGKWTNTRFIEQGAGPWSGQHADLDGKRTNGR